MASHSLAIAKASLAAGMIRPDPTSIPRTEVAHFHVLIEAVLRQCSSENIQLCKEWLLKNVIPSAARVAATGKYLVALSGSFKKAGDEDDLLPTKGQALPGRRKQLHILYLLNDLLHHTKYHLESSSAHSMLAGSLQSYLVDLFVSASAYNLEVSAGDHSKVQELLDIWDDSGYYESSYIGVLQEAVASAANSGKSNASGEWKAANSTGDDGLGEDKQESPYIMPGSHGDPSTPFYDLPAGNLLPHVIPNSSAPIDPQLVKPLQFVAGPADAKLVTAVKDFLQKDGSLEKICFEDDGVDMDLDELGESVLLDKLTGDVLEGDGYYGWSRGFCERMKRTGDGIRAFSNTVKRDDSMERRLSPRKRRRYSDSGSSRSGGRIRSGSIDSRGGTRRRVEPRSISRSRSASREQRQYRSLRSRSRSRSRSPSYSPPQTIPTIQQPSPVINAQPHHQAYAQTRSTRPPSFPHSYSKGYNLGPGGVPRPPPPPPNYQGQWPPPPPPIPTPNTTGPPNFALPPPPPIGPRQYQDPAQAMYPVGLQPHYQNGMDQRPGSWVQQFDHDGNYFQGGRGLAPPSFNGSAQVSRGRGFGGGWSK